MYFTVVTALCHKQISVWVVTLSVRLAKTAISPAIKVSIKLLKMESTIGKKQRKFRKKIKNVTDHQVLPATVF
ncbi:hypothetical protein AYI74_18980 [Shewanella algae]|nr:hypothetical protein BS332_09630 [Shewanella algae]TVL01657.1 hypothetical protein AYI72_14735 [Shewanella algae]TWU61601.1 hypothetical protein AYI74_18980 [Shewanella algae]UYA16397.1 hypothetical protein D3X10_11320 [Shewanella algae]